MTSALLPWPERPREIANLFNPAFCAMLISRVVRAHEDHRESGVALPLAFLILPILLDARTRSRLPRDADTDMFGWIADNHDLRALLPARSEMLTPVTQEALRFALCHQSLTIAGTNLVSGSKPFSKQARIPVSTDELQNCLQKAAFIGRWFARAASPVTLLATWGIRP